MAHYIVVSVKFMSIPVVLTPELDMFPVPQCGNTSEPRYIFAVRSGYEIALLAAHR